MQSKGTPRKLHRPARANRLLTTWTLRSTQPDDRLQTEAMISGLNAGLPRKLDEVSTLNKIDFHDNSFMYHIALATKITDSEAFRKNMREKLIKNICNNNGMIPRNRSQSLILGGAVY